MFNWNAEGLLPAITQDFYTKEVLMLAWMSQESLQQTLETGYATYYSRSRRQLWKKGETSGHVQRVCRIRYDCDADSLLLEVEQTGPACHTGSQTCFFETLLDTGEAGGEELLKEKQVIQARKQQPAEGSYTNYLFSKGLTKITKKVGEEAAEVIIAALAQSKQELVGETCDLFYHTMVLLEQAGVEPKEIYAELKKRRG